MAMAFPPAGAGFRRADSGPGWMLDPLTWDGPAETLQLTENAQPALMAVSIPTLRVLETEAGFSVGRDAAFVAGPSLGEYSALAAAGPPPGRETPAPRPAPRPRPPKTGPLAARAHA